MTTLGIIFMTSAWTFVTFLVIYTFTKAMKKNQLSQDD